MTSRAKHCVQICWALQVIGADVCYGEEMQGFAELEYCASGGAMPAHQACISGIGTEQEKADLRIPDDSNHSHRNASKLLEGHFIPKEQASSH